MLKTGGGRRGGGVGVGVGCMVAAIVSVGGDGAGCAGVGAGTGGVAADIVEMSSVATADPASVPSPSLSAICVPRASSFATESATPA